MAAKLLALISLVAIATAIPTPPPDSSPVPSETSNASPTPSAQQNKSGDSSVEDSKPSVEVEQFLTDMVNKMSKYRLMHGALPLVLSLNLTNKAELWAVKLANKDQEELNTNSQFGQAIFSSSKPDNVVNASVESWYNQIVHYRFDKPAATAKTNYFTQLIWKGTQEVGIGKASSSSGKTYVVAYFSPAGNNGDMLNNVLPVTGSGVGKLGVANCSEDYQYYNRSCFKLFPGPRTWESAVHKCTQEFASLASVDSEAEDYFIKSLLTEHKKNFTWIGLADINNDTFTWVDGTSNVFTNWDLVQSSVMDKKCVVNGESFRWKYIPCSKGTSFVCRRRLREQAIYELTIKYLNKLWSDKLLTPEESRYKALKTNIETAIMTVYQDQDWFEDVDFRGFTKSVDDKILASIRLQFDPDDDSPLDPLELLRNKLKGDSGSTTSKRTIIRGVLSGEPVEIVNATLVIEHPQPVLCPGFCTVQNCPASLCSQSCCNQNGLPQNPMGVTGYPGAQAQQPYQSSLYPSNSYQPNLYQNNPYQSTYPYRSSFPYTGYSGSPAPQSGSQVAPKPEEKPEEKTKPSSKEEDEAPKEPEEQSKPQISRPPRPASKPVGYPQPSVSGYPQNYPGQSYSQQQSNYQAGYLSQYYPYMSQTNPSLGYGSAFQQANSPSYSPYYTSNSQPYSPYQSAYSPYQSQSQSPYGYPSPYGSPYPAQPQNPTVEQVKPGRIKGRKGHKKRPRQNYQPGYGYGYNGQVLPSSYMSGASTYAISQVAGQPVMYGLASSYGSPQSSYPGAGYGSSMAAQNPYYAQACSGACASSCAPPCSPACCRSQGLQRRLH